MSEIARALEILNFDQATLARRLGVTPQAVSQWVRAIRPVPPRLTLEIERATNGAVTRHDLRPDVFGPAPSTKPATDAEARDAA